MTRTELLVTACLAKPGAWQVIEPWGGRRRRLKVSSKIFAFLGDGSAGTVGVKCGPDLRHGGRRVAGLRYPGDALACMAYIGRSGWNSLQFGGAIPDDEVFEAVGLVLRGRAGQQLPKKDRPAS